MDGSKITKIIKVSMVRFFFLSAGSLMMLAGCSTAPSLFIQQGAEGRGPDEVVQLFREFCPGGGRGLIHFDNVDGKTVRHNPATKGGWPTKLSILPGSHLIGMQYLAPDSYLYAHWRGEAVLTHQFQAGRVYLVRYHRDSADHFKSWIEELPLEGEIEATRIFCTQTSAFPDARFTK